MEKRIKKEVLIFAYLAFLISFLSSRESFSLLYQIVIVSLCFLSFFLQIKEKAFLPNRLAIFIILGSIVFFFFSKIQILNFLTDLLIVLSFLKFFSPIRERDIWQIYALSFAIICISSIWKFNISIGLFILLFTWCSISGLCFLNAYGKGFSRKRELIIFSSISFLLVIFISLFFFLFLPRTPYTISLPFGISQEAKIGFSEDMDIAEVEKIRENEEIAFRAIVPKRISDPYWRGIVYDTYRNGHWIRREQEEILASIPRCNLLKQIIFLEPYSGKTIFGLNFPIRIRILKPKEWEIRKDGDMFKSKDPIQTRLAYEVYSCVSDRIEEDGDIKRYLQIPGDIKGELKTFLKKNNIKGTADQIAEKIKYIFASSPFTYTRNIGKRSKADPIIQFLFFTHKGWCEHFASAAVLLLRAAGIPARLIGGYQGGVWNEKGKYFIVLQRNAHSWVEYFDGKYWKRFDPTPPTIEKEMGIKDMNFFVKWLDFLRIKWMLYVINYDYSKQKEFFNFLKRKISFGKMYDFRLKRFSAKKIKLLFLLIAILASIFIFLFSYSSKNRSYAHLLRHLLKRSGFEIKESEGLLEIAEKIKDKNKVLSDMVSDFAKDWYKVRFGKGIKKDEFFRIKYKKIKDYIDHQARQTDSLFRQ